MHYGAKVDKDSKEMARAILNGLPSQYESPFTTLDALEDDKGLFALELAKSRVSHEEQRNEICEGHRPESILTGAPVSRSRGPWENPYICIHCR